MTICTECHGRCRVVRTEPEVKTYSVYSTWQADGGRPQRHSYETGRTVERLYVCEFCSGTGRIADPVLRRTLDQQLALSDRAARS